MNILVTGGAGFIGSHVVDAYVAAGHTVSVLDDLSHGKRENINPAAQFLRMDLRSPGLKDLFAEYHFDCVIHHAAQIDVRVSVADPAWDAQVNILGTLNLLEAMRSHRVGKIIFASTGGAIYGNQHRYPADESHPTLPISPYGVAKLAVEHYLECYRQVHGLRYAVLRYANVYGPRQDPRGEAGVVAIFCGRILHGARLIIYDDGSQTRDYVYVGDVAEANVMALNYLMQAGSGQRAAGSFLAPKLNNSSTQPAESLPAASCQLPASSNDSALNGLNNSTTQQLNNSTTRPVFNIGTGIETSVNALAALLLQAANSDAPLLYQPPRTGEQLRSVIDPQRAAQELGWTPRTPLGEGLSRSLVWFRERQKGMTVPMAL
jgi:UDP-glucose 4-epimerase